MNRRRGIRNHSASVGLLVLTLAYPARADDFKLGIGGGATITTGNYADAYKSGWNTTARALWLPSFLIGARGAAYYGQNPPKTSGVLGTSIENSALYGADANVAIRLIGKGADGLYIHLGIGFRSLHQKTQSPNDGAVTQTDSNISYDAGAGFSSSWFFVEANGVYFKVQGRSLVSIPVTVGFQF
jgi:hypothetical protein